MTKKLGVHQSDVDNICNNKHQGHQWVLTDKGDFKLNKCSVCGKIKI